MKGSKLLLILGALGLVSAITVTTLLLWPTVDSATVTARPASKATGPETGQVRLAWERAMPDNSASAFASSVLVSLNPIGAGHLVSGLGHRLQAYDLRTGEPSWHHERPHRPLTTVLPTKGGVVARFANNDEDVLLVGLDPATGEERWTKKGAWTLQSADHRSIDPRAGVVAATDGSGRTHGIRADTGEISWTFEANAAVCDGRVVEERSKPAEPLVVFEPRCDRSKPGSPLPVVVAVGADDGAVVWTGRGHELWTGNGLIMVHRSDSVDRRLLGRDGETLYEPPPNTCGNICTPLAADGRAVLVTDFASRIVLIDPRTNEVDEFPVDIGGKPRRPIVVDDRLYLLAAVPDRSTEYPVPFELTIVDLDSREINTTDLPLDDAGSGRARGGDPRFELVNPDLVDVSGGRLVLSEFLRSESEDGDTPGKWVLRSYRHHDTSTSSGE